MNPVKIPLGATALLPLAVSTATAQETGASSKPNFVFIMTDQQRADLCGREGYPLDVTPFVDRMAGEGVWFDRAYTPAPISGPARVAFLTGRFPKATRVKSNHNIEDAVYKDDLFSFARRNGYRTALVGKNHAHLKPQNADCWRPYNHFAQQGRVDERPKPSTGTSARPICTPTTIRRRSVPRCSTPGAWWTTRWHGSATVMTNPS